MTDRPKHTFVVYRPEWRRGALIMGTPTCLLGKYCMKCCLGFAALQLGVPAEALVAIDTPRALLSEHHAKLQGTLLDGAEHTLLTKRAMEINDNPYIDDEERERRLSAVFAEHGCAMVFRG